MRNVGCHRARQPPVFAPSAQALVEQISRTSISYDEIKDHSCLIKGSLKGLGVRVHGIRSEGKREEPQCVEINC